MKKIITASAVMAAALLVFSGYAMARGGNSAGSRGIGTGSNGTSRMSVTRSCDGTGNCSQITAARVRAQDGSGNQYRHMNTKGTAQQAPQETTPSTN